MSPPSESTPPPTTLAQTLDNLSIVTANFADGFVLKDILGDWFEFLGGRPGQVVLLDNGSAANTQQACVSCYQEGMIDKLLLVKPGHCDTGRDINYIAEHTAPAIATKPYVLFFKIDCLPWRSGHEHWLIEAMSYLERPDTFAVGGSFNCVARHHDAWDPAWYFADKCSENFALMKREHFIAAMEDAMGGYISSGFRGESFVQTEDEKHYLIELAFERYMHKHGRYTLTRVEDDTWTVFHTNVHNERLEKVREKFRSRTDVKAFMNAANFTATFPHGVYYGKPASHAWHKRLRIALGASAFGPLWRTIKQSIGLGGVAS
jgi:hypothetical protein